MPVGDQGSRHDEEARPSGAGVSLDAGGAHGRPALHQEEETQHLDRLPQPHVVGQAGAQAEAREEPEPADPDRLVRPEHGPEGLGIRRGQPLRRAQVREGRREPLPGDHPGPVAPALRGRGRLSRFDRRPGQEAHRLPEGEALARGAPRALPVSEDLTELFPIELHPPSAHEREPVRAGEELAPLGVGDGLAVERQGDREVEERVQSQGSRRLAADGDADLEPPRPARVPPVGHANDDAGRFEDRHVLEELVGLARRPGERLEDVSGVHQVLEQGAAGRGAADGGEERQERRPVAGKGAERLAEGLMLRAGPAREPGRVGGEKREGMIAVLLVLRQVEVDASDEVPDGVPGLEVRLDAALVAADLLSEERLELLPPRLEPLRIDVLGSGQGRGLAREPVDHPRRDRDLHLGASLLEVADGAEPGDEEPREVPEEAQVRRQRGGHLDGAEMKEPGGRSLGEGGRDRPGRPRVERRRVGAVEEAEPARGGDREREPSLGRGGGRRVRRRAGARVGLAARRRFRADVTGGEAFRSHGGKS